MKSKKKKGWRNCFPAAMTQGGLLQNCGAVDFLDPDYLLFLLAIVHGWYTNSQTNQALKAIYSEAPGSCLTVPSLGTDTSDYMQ